MRLHVVRKSRMREGEDCNEDIGAAFRLVLELSDRRSTVLSLVFGNSYVVQVQGIHALIVQIYIHTALVKADRFIPCPLVRVMQRPNQSSSSSPSFRLQRFQYPPVASSDPVDEPVLLVLPVAPVPGHVSPKDGAGGG